MHTLPIRSIAFGEGLSEKGEKRYKLYTIGNDRKMVEYEVPKNEDGRLKVL